MGHENLQCFRALNSRSVNWGVQLKSQQTFSDLEEGLHLTIYLMTLKQSHSEGADVFSHLHTLPLPALSIPPSTPCHLQLSPSPPSTPCHCQSSPSPTFTPCHHQPSPSPTSTPCHRQPSTRWGRTSCNDYIIVTTFSHSTRTHTPHPGSEDMAVTQLSSVFVISLASQLSYVQGEELEPNDELDVLIVGPAIRYIILSFEVLAVELR